MSKTNRKTSTPQDIQTFLQTVFYCSGLFVIGASLVSFAQTRSAGPQEQTQEQTPGPQEKPGGPQEQTPGPQEKPGGPQGKPFDPQTANPFGAEYQIWIQAQQTGIEPLPPLNTFAN